MFYELKFRTNTCFVNVFPSLWLGFKFLNSVFQKAKVLNFDEVQFFKYFFNGSA